MVWSPMDRAVPLPNSVAGKKRGLPGLPNYLQIRQDDPPSSVVNSSVLRLEK